MLLLKVAVMVVRFTTTTLLMLKPVDGGRTATVDPGTKFVPVRVTFTDVPRNSKAGEMDVSTGAGGATTVNVTALLLPVGVVTVTLRALNVALDAMVKVVVIVVTVVVSGPTVMPVPDTFTAEASKSPEPVIVTGTTVPCAPLVGEMDAIVATPLPWNSTAPTSTALFVFLELPKKSKLGAAA